MIDGGSLSMELYSMILSTELKELSTMNPVCPEETKIIDINHAKPQLLECGVPGGGDGET